MAVWKASRGGEGEREGKRESENGVTGEKMKARRILHGLRLRRICMLKPVASLLCVFLWIGSQQRILFCLSFLSFGIHA